MRNDTALLSLVAAAAADAEAADAAAAAAESAPAEERQRLLAVAAAAAASKEELHWLQRLPRTERRVYRRSLSPSPSFSFSVRAYVQAHTQKYVLPCLCTSTHIEERSTQAYTCTRARPTPPLPSPLSRSLAPALLPSLPSAPVLSLYLAPRPSCRRGRWPFPTSFSLLLLFQSVQAK